jgi:hypothetical protein
MVDARWETTIQRLAKRKRINDNFCREVLSVCNLIITELRGTLENTSIT